MFIDTLNFKVAVYLMRHGRATWTTLGHQLGLSGPAVAERVHRLEAQGIIRGYAALVDPSAVGANLTAFVTVTLERPEHRAAFLARVGQLVEIQECHHIAGEDDYLLKIRCSGTRALDQVISQDIKGLPGILRTRTTIALDTLKETPVLPVYADLTTSRRSTQDD